MTEVLAVDCVFCGIVSGSEPASILARDDLVLAFLDIRPVTIGHALVVSNRHRRALADLTDAEAARMLAVGRRLAAALRRSPVAPTGVNLFYADGVSAGQEVDHAHLHVIPRRAGDGFSVTATAWTQPGPTRSALDELAVEIAAAYLAAE